MSHPRRTFPAMNRISHTQGLVQALLESLDAKHPVEALILDRVRLIRILQRSLAELHEHRRLTTGTLAEPDTTQLIKYWDAVLGWVKDQQGSDLVFMSRTK